LPCLLLVLYHVVWSRSCTKKRAGSRINQCRRNVQLRNSQQLSASRCCASIAQRTTKKIMTTMYMHVTTLHAGNHRSPDVILHSTHVQTFPINVLHQ